MKKKTILIAILIISTIATAYFSFSVLKSGYSFKDSFVDFETPANFQMELEKGQYDFFEVSDNATLKKENNYKIITKQINPLFIEISLDTVIPKSKYKTTIKYTIFGKEYTKIGDLEVSENQTATIISTVKSNTNYSLAYRLKSNDNSIFAVLKNSITLLISLGFFLISGFLLLIGRKKK